MAKARTPEHDSRRSQAQAAARDLDHVLTDLPIAARIRADLDALGGVVIRVDTADAAELRRYLERALKVRRLALDSACCQHADDAGRCDPTLTALLTTAHDL